MAAVDRGVSARGRARWFAVAALALVALLYVANLHFHACQTLESGLHRRMEHGRRLIRKMSSDQARPKPFWVDVSNGPPRRSAQRRRYAPDGWAVTIPLWIPLGLCVAWCVVSWRRRAAAPSAGGS
jgi:hypothetical protein